MPNKSTTPTRNSDELSRDVGASYVNEAFESIKDSKQSIRLVDRTGSHLISFYSFAMYLIQDVEIAVSIADTMLNSPDESHSINRESDHPQFYAVADAKTLFSDVMVVDAAIKAESEATA